MQIMTKFDIGKYYFVISSGYKKCEVCGCETFKNDQVFKVKITDFMRSEEGDYYRVQPVESERMDSFGFNENDIYETEEEAEKKLRQNND